MSKKLSTVEKRIMDSKKLLLEQLERIPIIQISCEKTNVSRATFYRWKQEDPEFARLAEEAINSGVEIINDLAESKLIANIRDGNFQAVAYWLRHRHRAYSNRIELEGHIQTSHELDDEQKALFEKAVNLVFGGKND